MLATRHAMQLLPLVRRPVSRSCAADGSLGRFQSTGVVKEQADLNHHSIPVGAVAEDEEQNKMQDVILMEEIEKEIELRWKKFYNALDLSFKDETYLQDYENHPILVDEIEMEIELRRKKFENALDLSFPINYPPSVVEISSIQKVKEEAASR